MIDSSALNQLLESRDKKRPGMTENRDAILDQLRTIGETSATLERIDLGRRVSASSAHDYGNVKTAREPYVIFGSLHLRNALSRLQPLLVFLSVVTNSPRISPFSHPVVHEYATRGRTVIVALHSTIALHLKFSLFIGSSSHRGWSRLRI